MHDFLQAILKFLAAYITTDAIIGLVVGILLCYVIKRSPFIIHIWEKVVGADGSIIGEKITKSTFAFGEDAIGSRKETNQKHVEIFDLKNISIKGNHIDVEHFLEAANKGDAESQFTLGVLYSLGKGVKKNKSEAVCWFRKAAEQDFARAQYNLALSYDSGEGVEKNKSEAARWFRKAAEQGDVNAQFILGADYHFGRRVEKNKSEAARWFRKAAEQGDSYAQFNLALSYDSGEGVNKDKREAVRWFHKAAEQGDVYAQFNLSSAYDNGEGVVANKHKAYTWLIIAKASGNKKAKNLLNNEGWNFLLTSEEMESARQEAEKMFNEIESRRTKE